MQLIPNAKAQFIDQNGLPLASGTVGFYFPGTLNPKATYQDSAGTISNTNPVQLDSRGQALIWGSGVYRQIVKDASGVTIWDQITEDPNSGLIGNVTNARWIAGASYSDPTGNTPGTFVPGTTTTFNLPAAPGTIDNLWPYFDTSFQTDDQISSLNGTTLVFASAVPIGIQEVEIKIGSTVAVGVPADGSVTDAKVSASSKLSNRLTYWIDVRDAPFNAKVDGSTDDAAAINAAITAANVAGGGVVLIPEGVAIVGSEIVHKSNVTLQGAGQGATIIRAKAGVNFQYVIHGDTTTSSSIRDLTVDANQQNRASVQTAPYYCVLMFSCIAPLMENVKVMNSLGTASASAVGCQFGGLSQYGRIHNCIAEACGIVGQASDGFFCSGTQNLMEQSIANGCTDTGFVIESSFQSGIVGCTAVNCSAGGAITNASANPAVGNYIDGLTIQGWNSLVTGGMSFGNPSPSTTGNLIDTNVSNVTMTGGTGVAIVVMKNGSAITDGIKFNNVTVDGSTAQCMVATANNLQINGGRYTCGGGSGSSALQFQNGSTTIQVKGATIDGAFQFGIRTDSISNVTVCLNTITGNGSTANYGFYAFNTASNVKAGFNDIAGTTIALVGSDAGTSIQSVNLDTAHPGLIFGPGSNAANLYYGGVGLGSAPVLRSDGRICMGAGLGVGNAVNVTSNGPQVSHFPVFDASGTVQLGFVPVYSS
jgi:hypothetical protein